MHDIHRIKPYKPDMNIEYVKIKICVMMSTYDCQLCTFVLY